MITIETWRAEVLRHGGRLLAPISRTVTVRCRVVREARNRPLAVEVQDSGGRRLSVPDPTPPSVVPAGRRRRRGIFCVLRGADEGEHEPWKHDGHSNDARASKPPLDRVSGIMEAARDGGRLEGLGEPILHDGVMILPRPKCSRSRGSAWAQGRHCGPAGGSEEPRQREAEAEEARRWREMAVIVASPTASKSDR